MGKLFDIIRGGGTTPRKRDDKDVISLASGTKKTRGVSSRSPQISGSNKKPTFQRHRAETSHAENKNKGTKTPPNDNRRKYVERNAEDEMNATTQDVNVDTQRDVNFVNTFDSPKKKTVSRETLLKESKSFFNMGTLYFNKMQDYEKSKTYFKQCLKVRLELCNDHDEGNHVDVAAVYEMLGNVEHKLDQLEFARGHYELSLGYIEKTKEYEVDHHEVDADTAGQPKTERPALKMKLSKQPGKKDKSSREIMEEISVRVEESIATLPQKPKPPPIIPQAAESSLQPSISFSNSTKAPLGDISSSWIVKKNESVNYISKIDSTETDDSASLSSASSDSTTDKSTATSNSLFSDLQINPHLLKLKYKTIQSKLLRRNNRRRSSFSEMVHDKHFNQGCLHLADKNPAEAKHAFEKSYRNRVNELGEDHIEVCITREKLGDAAAMEGQFDEAQIHYEAALRRLRQKLINRNKDKNSARKKDLVIARILISSGDMYLEGHKYTLAIKNYEEARPILKEHLEENSKDLTHNIRNTIFAYEEIIKVAATKKNYDEAYLQYEKAFKIILPFMQKEGPGTSKHEKKQKYQVEYLCLRMGKVVGNLQGEMKQYDSALSFFNYVLSTVRYSEETVGSMPKRNQKETAIVLHNMGILYEKKNDLDSAMEYYQKSLIIKKRVFPSHHEKVAKTVNCIGFLHFIRGETDQALVAFQNSTDILSSQPLTSGNYQVQATTLNKMAILHAQKNQMKDTLACLSEKVNLAQRFLGYHHNDVAETYHRMGCIYYQINQFDQAIECHQKALRIKKVKLAQNSPELGLTLRYLAASYSAADMNEEAIKYYDQALMASTDFDKVNIFNRMGILYHTRHQTEEAIECYQRGLSIQEALGSEDKDNLGISLLNNMGNVYCAAGHYDKAMECYEKVFDFSTKIQLRFPQGRHGPINAMGMNILHYKRLSVIDVQQVGSGNGQALVGIPADSFNEEGLIQVSSSSDQHDDCLDEVIARWLNNIGNIHLKRKEYDQAFEAYSKSLALKEKTLSSESEEVVGSLGNLGSAYFAIDEDQKAIECYQKAIHIMDSQNYSGNRSKSLLVASLLNKIGNVHMRTKNHSVAMKNYTDSLNLKKSVSEENSKEILISEHNIGLALAKAERYKEAEKVLSDVYEKKKNLFGENHPEILRILLDLSILNLTTKRIEKAQEYCKMAITVGKHCGDALPKHHPYIQRLGDTMKRIKKSGRRTVYFAN